MFAHIGRLRALTSGHGRYTMQLDHYAPAPARVAAGAGRKLKERAGVDFGPSPHSSVSCAVRVARQVRVGAMGVGVRSCRSRDAHLIYHSFHRIGAALLVDRDGLCGDLL